MAKHNPWMDHLKKFRAAHPGMDNKLIFAEAKKTYHHAKQSGGAALGGDLSPEPISGIHHTSGGAALQIGATQYSGGKSRRKRSNKKRSNKKRSAKKRSAKRRH
jgi:hypothetical protein